MSLPRNSNISNWQDQNDCDCPKEGTALNLGNRRAWGEGTDQQILDNLKSEMDEHARDLKARRDQHQTRPQGRPRQGTGLKEVTLGIQAKTEDRPLQEDEPYLT